MDAGAVDGLLAERTVEQICGVELQPSAGSFESAWIHPTDQMTDEDGGLAPGALFVLADTILGYRCLRDGHVPPIITNYLHIDIASPVLGAHATIGGTGDVETFDDSGILASARLTDQDDELVGRVTGRFATPRLSRAAETVRPQVVVPFKRAEKRSHSTGEAPVHELLGFRRVEEPQGGRRVTMRAGKHLANSRGGIHGGIAALMAEQAASHALRGLIAPDATMSPIEMRVVFLRPIPANGSDIDCHAEVVHIGKTGAESRARLTIPDGRPAVLLEAVYTPAPRREPN